MTNPVTRALRLRVISGSPLLAVAFCLAAAVLLTATQAQAPTGGLLQESVRAGRPEVGVPDEFWQVLLRSVLRVTMFAAAAVTLTWRARAARPEASVWRWFARTAWVAAAASMLAGVVDCLTVRGPLEGVGGGGAVLGAGVLAACPLLYQGLVRWNRYGTHLSEPGDWLNGIGAAFALTAIGNLLLPLVDSPIAAWPLWQEQLWLLRISAEITLLGSAATILHIGGLHRDVRAWALTLSLAAVVGVEVAAVHDPVAAVGNGPVSELGWTLLAVTFALTAVLRAVPPLARPVTTTAPTAGAFVALLASIVVLVAAGLSSGTVGGRATTAAAVAGGLGAISVSVRGVQLIRLLADLVVHRREALTDDLTDLANRRALNLELGRAYRAGRDLTLVLIDLDGFKRVNDRFGHAVGDELLRRAATVVRSAAGPDTFTARFGGDEFAVALPTASVDEAADLVAALARETAAPVLIGGRRLLVTGSIGIASSLDADDPEQLLALADAAVYRAKAAGGARAAVHDDAAAAEAAEEVRLVEELQALLGNPDAVPGTDPGRLDVHYQPQLDRLGRVVGVEALVRWRNARRGLLPPDVFLPLVEDYGLMPALTGAVLRQAAEQTASWRARGWRVRLSVNLSATCLTHPALSSLVDDVLADTGLPPSDLVLEVTETSVMADPAGSVARLLDLADRGVEISIDDYGTGYSSLAYLRDLPAAELKLDRSLVADVGTDPRADETVEVLHVLRQLGCDETQGYLHSRPLSAADFERWFERSRAACRLTVGADD
ncbi:putative bifunctional diguanylate cyclase/phosphodiesterase [Kineococcus sp. SYSU DK003]|uniref:putative bifunctional diguanylate cyclase/phosphodiesterase n=1 Tax=Kineococcus sp. SYSU DK003 TaxID=3383124 RepID=UPI003D7C3D23